MKKTSFEIESDISMIEEEVRSDYRLPDHFAGDSCIQDIFDLESKMRRCKNEEDYDEVLNEVKELYLSYVPEEVEFEGKHWGDLTHDEQESLLEVANVSDDLFDKKTGECTIDFQVLSVAAKINLNSDEADDFEIDDDAVLYNSRR